MQCGTHDVDISSANVSVTFQWLAPANDVFVVGSFSNWQNKVALQKIKDVEFKCTLQIPPGP